VTELAVIEVKAKARMPLVRSVRLPRQGMLMRRQHVATTNYEQRPNNALHPTGAVVKVGAGG
jgi:hypothetical protein